MSKKAVYNNKMLAIYITGDDFKKLLDSGTNAVPIYIGKVKTGNDYLVVDLISEFARELLQAYQLEHEAIEAARPQAVKSPVRYDQKNENIWRKKRG